MINICALEGNWEIHNECTKGITIILDVTISFAKFPYTQNYKKSAHWLISNLRTEDWNMPASQSILLGQSQKKSTTVVRE